MEIPNKQAIDTRHQVTFEIATERLLEFCDWLDNMVPNWEPSMFYTRRLFKKQLKLLMSSFYNDALTIKRLRLVIFNLTKSELMLAKLTWDIISHD